MMFRLATPIVICTLLLTSGCGHDDEVTGDLTWVFGDSQAVETFKQTTLFEAYRSEPPSDPNEFIQTLEQFRPTSTPVSISGDLAAELQDILLDSSTYYWEAAKACDPNFGVRIHYQNGDDEFDILLCFQCDILAVYKNGKAVGGEDFDSARSRLVKIVQELFPDDDTIQSLN